MEGSSNSDVDCDKESVLVTPYQKQELLKSELELVSNRKQIQMLGDSVIMYESEIQKLKSEMLDLQAKFSLEKDELHFDIAIFSKMKIELTSKLEDCQCRNKELENKLRQYEAEKLKQEELHASQQIVLQDEINCLREELGQKIHFVEAANKELEMVVIERDEANAKIDKLEADVCSRDDKLSNKKKYIEELEGSQKRQLVDFETLKELLINKKINMNERTLLKLRVEELAKEVSRQNGVISGKDEEKREAIRQLCYSLDYYRTRCSELLKLKDEELNKQKEFSKEEIFKLKIQIENRLDNVRQELKLKEEELNKLKELSKE